MKKLFLTFIFLLPTIFANAQGIKAWNDQLDDFIEVLNNVNPALAQLYSEQGIGNFGFTYYDPDTENVVMEAQIFDSNDFDKIDDQLIGKAKDITINHIAGSAAGNDRINSILNEFDKRNTEIVILYSTTENNTRLTKSSSITPKEIRAVK